MGIKRATASALSILQDLGLRRLRFQVELAHLGLDAIESRERLIVISPTGTGKTLISQLTMTLLARSRERPPRVLVIVPTRALAIQHLLDAGWMRDAVPTPLHSITSTTPRHIVSALLESLGIFITTPITLSHRLTLPGALEQLKSFDCAIFDEIDTFLSVEENSEHRGTFPALQACLDADLPVLGFTGTGLTAQQERAWETRGFEFHRATVPADWLPMTQIRFVGVIDKNVIDRDKMISAELGVHFDALSNPPWRAVKSLARAGDSHALKILHLCGQRLELFESFGSALGKWKQLKEFVTEIPSCLVMTRYKWSATDIVKAMHAYGIEARIAHGAMHREELSESLNCYRNQDPDSPISLVITRDLGSRGLDFPRAAGACIFSPRSNYQTVIQEVARIRSRCAAPKTVVILYFEETTEAEKARRLARRLRDTSYDGVHLFTVDGISGDKTLLHASYESGLLIREESLKRDPQSAMWTL